MNIKKFEEIITLQRGYDLPERKRKSGTVPLIASTGIATYIDVPKCSGPGVVTGRSGSIGKVIYIDKPYWPLNTTLFVKDFHGNNPKYISYWLSVFPLSKYSNGASVPTLNRNELTGVDCFIHSLDEQQHIVNTIGSVDDLIENYNDQIKKIIYLLKTNILKYKEEVSIDYYNPIIIKSGIEQFTKYKLYIDTSSLDGVNNLSKFQNITFENKPLRANMQPTADSIWFAKMKESYKILILTNNDLDIIENCILSTGYLGIKCNENFPLSLAVSIIISDKFTLERDNNSVGTTMMGINNETFKNIKVPKLTKVQIAEYDANNKDFIIQLSILRRKIKKLFEIKQILLDKYF